MSTVALGFKITVISFTESKHHAVKTAATGNKYTVKSFWSEVKRREKILQI